MKKTFFALILAIAISCSVALPAYAVRFKDLGSLQNYLLIFSPDRLLSSGPHIVEVEGTISDLHWSGSLNDYLFTLYVDDPTALAPLGVGTPYMTVCFSLHKDEPPFKDGDQVEICGHINSLYSSVIVPWVTLKTINGSSDF